MGLNDHTPPSRRIFLLALLLPGLAWGAPGLSTLGKRYRALRARDAANPPGTFDPETDGAGGELFRVMDTLRSRLGRPGQRGAKVRKVMGPPDAVKPVGDAPPADHPAGTTERWIYFWRGWHDYLYFEVDARARILGADWWMAGD